MIAYLAGHIEQNCWRHQFVPELRNPPFDIQADTCGSHLSLPRFNGAYDFPLWEKAVLGRHDYIGPYFVSCDHGCQHGQNRHGVLTVNFEEEYHEHRAGVLGLCKRAIDKTDLVFAWIEKPDCYGTIAEIGYAYAKGKKIWIAGLEEFADMWLAYEMSSDKPIFAFRDAVDAFETFESLEGGNIKRLDFEIATAKQIWYLRKLGYQGEVKKLTKGDAGKLIHEFKTISTACINI